MEIMGFFIACLIGALPHPSWLQVVQQTYPELKRQLGPDNGCWLWPSITQNAYQTAEVLAALLMVGRNQVREGSGDLAWGIICLDHYAIPGLPHPPLTACLPQIVPEFSFLDARGVGELERLPLGEAATALAVGDALSPTWRPAPNVDGTVRC
jgi:hypothetical protein